MSVFVVFVFIFSVATGTGADKVQYKSYSGLDREINIPTDVETAMSQLNRYCGSGSYNYNNYNSNYNRPTSYYRPTNNYNNGHNLGDLLSPVVFGLATGAGIGLIGNILG